MDFLKMLFPCLFLNYFAESSSGGSGTDTETADSETAEESSTEKTEGQGEEGASAGDEKTESSETKDDELKDDGQPIPFDRFKQVVTQRNEIRKQLEKSKNLKTDLEEKNNLLHNPEVYQAILKSQGITDPKIIKQKMIEEGFEETEGEVSQGELLKQFSEGLDLSKSDGWMNLIMRASQYFAKKETTPIVKEITSTKTQEWIREGEASAKKLAKDVYKIEYGQSGKDEENPNTAVGIMSAYLEEHPEDAGLGHSKILKLAMAEKGFQIGKKQGITEEQERNENLKASQMEEETQTTKIKTPTEKSSLREIMDYARVNIK